MLIAAFILCTLFVVVSAQQCDVNAVQTCLTDFASMVCKHACTTIITNLNYCMYNTF